MSRLTVKLMLAFLAVAIVGIGLAALLSDWSTERHFLQFALHRRLGEVQNALANHYAARGGWGTDAEVLLRPGGVGPPFGWRRGHPLALADADGVVVVAGAGYRAGERLSDKALVAGQPIVVADVRVGTLLSGESLVDMALGERDFVGRVRRALVLGGLGATAVALLMGVVLARGFTRPLRQLAAASRAIAAGDLDTRVPVGSHDEIGQLAAAFNHMAADLACAEEARQQQAADIAHELRTPLTVIQGHLQALADGVLPPDPENLDPALEQARLLARLVEDLRTLSLADAGRLALVPVSTEVSDWVSDVAAGFRAVAADRRIALDLEVANDLPRVRIDPERMAQVLGNLLDNTLRHTPEGGRVGVHVARGDGGVVVSVTDTGPGVPPEHLPHLFERFWRGDPSRSRRTGGSGLGLAIARRIVEAHGGRIWAEDIAEGGLRISFSLPGNAA